MPKILIIEDETELREEIIVWLNFKDFEAIGAADGIEGVNLALQHQPDLILCDRIMPHLDGFGVVQRLRADPATQKIPVIFVSARSESRDIQDGLALGVCSYVTKPFSFADLFREIYNCLQRRSEG